LNQNYVAFDTDHAVFGVFVLVFPMISVCVKYEDASFMFSRIGRTT